ncbi:phenylacetate-CoA ligase [Kribbella sp. VKM Ac-2571]|uniref:phenylacetate--CoA ligase PaaK n=1 Tax=Kribbella sp. VKM Ac-2571 TaxID=2512222 RepID=UPI00105E23E7|nr:phenylacetate--CoA ligase PaaK [Kribbella sp. VKM Ac-2571]TDO67632.1 phenylacetate-CoA ligase [Kribbella sp. VKM Ac-2571]
MLGDACPPELRDAGEQLSVDELRAQQLSLLQATVRRAYENVPHYRAALDAVGFKPGDLGDLSDLSRLPFTAKKDLRDNYPFGMFAVPRTEVVRVHASSGTTGRPTVVGYTKSDLDNWADLMARSIRAAGGRAGDVCHVAYGYGLFTGGLGAHYGAERLGCTVVPVSGGMTERQVDLIRDFGARIIMVTPSYFLAIVDEMEARGLDPRDTSLRIGIFGAEPWTEQMRTEVEERTGIHAVDIYGLSEVMGPGVAQECVETKDGLHIWEDHFYPEIIDPVTGDVLPDGSEGELVFTTLTKEAFPVLRYRTRDLTRLMPGTARPGMRRMEKITGRTDDMMIVRGVNVFPTQIEEQILLVEGLTPHYLCVLTRPNRLDELTVQVEAAPDLADRSAAATTLARRIKDRVGVTAAVEVLDPHALERSLGKAKRIKDNR